MQKGSIEIIVGSMFSGKTHELIRRLRLCAIAKKKVQIFKSCLDDRYKHSSIVSHDGAELEGVPVRSSSQILEMLKSETQVVGIDEAQFFDPGIIDICELLANKGIRVITAGLDLDYRGMPFEITAQLMARAETATKNLAICTICGEDAHYSQRLGAPSTERVVVGATETYQARCRRCFEPPADSPLSKLKNNTTTQVVIPAKAGMTNFCN
ncbi:MAG: thymidine kinase [Elusimicrobia bacterium]|nr:thymidine kinase [Elusimicrobiota bacterium]